MAGYPNMTPHYETPEAVEAELVHANILLARAIEALDEARRSIKPAEDEYESALHRVCNLECRLTTARQKAKH